jgi:hypothetical protein
LFFNLESQLRDVNASLSRGRLLLLLLPLLLLLLSLEREEAEAVGLPSTPSLSKCTSGKQ